MIIKCRQDFPAVDIISLVINNYYFKNLLYQNLFKFNKFLSLRGLFKRFKTN